MKRWINIDIFKMLLHNHLITLVVLGFSAILFKFFIHWVLVSSVIGDSIGQLLRLLPPQMRAFLGEETLGFLSPLGFISISYTHPFLFVLFTIFPISLFNREISSSSEKGTIELTLGRPVSRSCYIITLAIFFLCGLIFLSLCQAIGVIISLHSFPVHYPFKTFLPAIINFACLFIFIGFMSMLISVSSKHGSKAAGTVIGFTLGLYFLEYIGRTIKFIGATAYFNPFHYYRPQNILSTGNFPSVNLLVLALSGLILFAISVYRFKRRDL